MKSPGLISSLREPTAENATMTRTPNDLSAAIFARAGMFDGDTLWPVPCLAKKAMYVPFCRRAIVIGELGNPQGCILHVCHYKYFKE